MVFSQNGDEFDFQQHIENIFAGLDQEIDYEELYEAFFFYYQNPFNLNTVTADELRALYLLSEFQINSFLTYRQTYGPFQSYQELMAVENFNKVLIQKLMPLTEITSIDKNSASLRAKLKSRLMIRYTDILETKKGYLANENDSLGKPTYSGSSQRLYTRFNAHKNDRVSLGFLMEKDPGEKIHWDPESKHYGMDFYSYHLMLENRGFIKRIIVGNYKLEFGEHLLLGSGFSIGKGAETINTIRKNSRGIKPYQSAMESNFFTGIATTLQFGQFSLTPFYSTTNEDATLEKREDSTTYCSSISSTGYHRTSSELKRKNQLKRKVYGMNLNYQSKDYRLQTGITYLNTHLEYPLIPKEKPYNYYYFNGSDNHNFGAYYNYLIKYFYFFGEAACSKSGGKGIVSGVISNLNDYMYMSLLYRYYEQDFHSFYGSAFSESNNHNEQGFYWGIKWRILNNLDFNYFIDVYEFPWLKYHVDAPSKGSESLLRINYKLNPGISIYGQYRYKKKMDNKQDTIPMPGLTEQIKHDYLVNLDVSANEWLNLRTRIAFNDFHDSHQSDGFAFAQDLNLLLGKFNIYTRFSMFDTERYDNRLYIYERDLLYSFSLPALHGKGLRSYMMLKWNINSYITLWAKYARSRFNDRSVIGTGSEEINKNRKSDIKLQLYFKF